MPDPSRNIPSILAEALEFSTSEERKEFLDQACGDDAEIRREVERLISEYPGYEGFLRGDGAKSEKPVVPETPDLSGTEVDTYQLIKKIGEGGVGDIYLAEQTAPVRRRVALKIIKPGMDSRQVIARFEAERQALAMMEHDNIAKVYDAGTTKSGRPYFVMEYIDGVPITQFCDNQQLSPWERLELFIPVCQAIQHAHQKGIIHRDLKPTNILIAKHDSRPSPKVIDFGVAKAIQQRVTENSVITELGWIIGTLEYMSPEQARADHMDVDTRSDVYSLGVVLYELLTGAAPFDARQLRKMALDEMMRVIREEESPPPLENLRKNAALLTIAANRRIEPQRLAKLVRGELEWIIMKALDKDRSRRYATVSALADDVQNFLHHQPISAGRPSRFYRFGKFLQRNRLGAISVAFVALSIVVTGSVLAWQEYRTLHADATAARLRADAVVAQAELRNSNQLAAIAILGAGHERLHATSPGKRQEFAHEFLPQLIERRRLVDDDSKRDELDYHIRSLWIEANSSFDLVEDPAILLPIRANWAVALHPHGNAAVVAGRTRPLFVKRGEREIAVPPSEAIAGARVYYSRSGNFIAFVSAEGQLSLWDGSASTRLTESSLPPIPGLLDVSFQSDDHHLDILAANGEFIRLSVPALLEIERYSVHSLSHIGRQVKAGALSKRADRFAFGDEVGNVLVATGEKEEARFSLGKDPIVSLRWSDDSRFLAVGYQTRVVVISMDVLVITQILSVPFARTVGRISITPDNRLLMAANCIWDLDSGEFILQPTQEVADVSRDGNTFLESGNHEIRFVTSIQPSTAFSCRGHRSTVLQSAWSGDSRRFTTIDNDFVMCIWQPDGGKLLHRIELPRGSLIADNGGVALSQDGTLACVMYEQEDKSGRAYYINVETGELSKTIDLPISGFFRVAFNATEGQFIGLCERRDHNDPGARTSLIKLTTTGSLAGPIETLQHPVTDETGFFDHFISAEGNYYTWVGPRMPVSACRAEIWDLKSASLAMPVRTILLARSAPDFPLPSVLASSDGRQLWVRYDTTLECWPMADANVPSISSPQWKSPYANSFGGRWLLAPPRPQESYGGPLMSLDVYDSVYQIPRAGFRRHREAGTLHPGAITFSPNSRWLTWESSEGGRLTIVDQHEIETSLSEILAEKYGTSR